MRKVKVSEEFCHRLENRDQKQGRLTVQEAVEFRNKFLSYLYEEKAWKKGLTKLN